MAQQIHFISGLPRSGSTLLAAILRQSPATHAAIQTPLAEVMAATVRSLSLHESAMFVSDAQRRAVLSSIVAAYYQHLAGKELVFDTNRAWCSLLNVIATVLPNAKVICCVRSPAWILDSMERRVQAEPLRAPGLFGPETGNVFTRAEAMWKALLGSSLNAFKQAFYGEHADRLFVVRYDSLVSRPGKVLGAMYQFLGHACVAHDFSKVDYDEPEFDDRLGMPGLHRVHGKVEPRKREPIIPPELFRQYDAEFWSGMGANPRQVTIV